MLYIILYVLASLCCANVVFPPNHFLKAQQISMDPNWPITHVKNASVYCSADSSFPLFVLSHPSPAEFVEVLSEVRRVEERLRPFIERTHSILGAATSADYNNNVRWTSSGHSKIFTLVYLGRIHLKTLWQELLLRNALMEVTSIRETKSFSADK